MPFSAGDDSLLNFNEDSFDFNLQFEQLFFSILPSALFIVTSAWRTFSQARKPTLVNAPALQLTKLGAITLYVGLELSLLIMVSIGSFRLTGIFTASSVLNLVAALFMVAVSLIDHSKSPRPSILLNSYLFLTLLLDVAQVRTLFLSSTERPELAYSSIYCASVILKVVILLLESQRKSRWLGWNEKEHSPEETSNIFSLGVFFWLNRLFWDGYSKILTLGDLYPLDSTLDSSLLHDRFAHNFDHYKLRNDKHGLLKGLLKTLKVHILLPVPPRIALVGFTVAQPFFIERLLEHLAKPKVESNVGYGFIGASILIYSGMAVSTALCWYFHHRMRTMLRAILVTEIYHKATKFQIGAGDDNAAVTLMSTDIERIYAGLNSMHDIWASLIQAAVAAWMLYRHLGVVFVTPIGLVLLCFAALIILMRFTGASQRTWMAGVQKRVGLTATVIASMKNLKISGLSMPIGEFVQKLRVDELAAGVHYRKIAIGAALLGFMPFLLGPPLTFASAGQTLDTTTIFSSLSWLLLLNNPLTLIFNEIPRLLSGVACLGRIQSFLESETRQDFRKSLADVRAISGSAPSDSVFTYPLSVEDGGFGWKPDAFVLQNINLQVRQSSLTIVIGSIGSGKSTLCKAMLGEVPFRQGTVLLSTIIPRVGYCDQTPFLSNGTIRDNIVGFSPFIQQRYDEVLAATSLTYDLHTLPQGDQTNVGSNGITLSGGQKQRVSLARALYLQTNLLILDDIFSGLDADTEEQVFRQVFGPDGLLRQRQATAILCTHSVRHLPAADHVIVLGNGTVLEQGSFSDLAAQDGYVQRLGLSESSASDSSSDMSNDIPAFSSGSKPNHIPKLPQDPPSSSSGEANLDVSRQAGDLSVYKHYFRSMGWVIVAWSLFFAVGWGFFTNFPTIWLKYWSESSDSDRPSRSFGFYAGLYTLFQASALMSLLLVAIMLYVTSVKRAGATVHRQALQTLLHAPLRFFTTTDTGIVTNLFSQDLNLIDTELPNGLLNTLSSTFATVGQAAVMLSLSPYIAISYPFLVVFLYFVQKFYLRTSRQLRLLDLEAKSPLYTHFLDTVNGIITLRAFGFTASEIQKNAGLLNTSQRPAYLLVMIQQWLTLVLDLVVMAIAALLTTLAVRLHSNSGFTGASLVTLMGFGENISAIVIFYTRLETSIGAIARLKTFNETVKPEDKDDEDIIPPEEWPQSGVIELKGVSASYAEENSPGGVDALPLALRNISLRITSAEKIAICGRTGSGKSSFIALLLKLLDPTSDTALNAVVDGTPLHRIDRSALRQRIIAVPQEAVFLPDGSTFQANLDPLNGSTSKECRDVLVAVKLWDFVQERGGLEAGMSPGTLSAGQRQLLSLSRALLRRRKRAQSLGIGGGGSEGGILLLDEVSSSVDQETERLMQDIIRAEFRNYTVVAVSHRLDMIMDFDRVVVMDKGDIVEVGNPSVLAGESGTRFGELVRAAK
ncbi:P-loop containing nucleoside triphosphate hydrolase protein [Cladorrhinum samala]|uniref:P-loop containing nucleoside triphosphate hydrolase protein n=1 Tax=Cladorrhinum samala TaxID=585594 RepID=A0AAV9HTG9_9PEZI|nr:P-loop containing nucleoside triphosphate hydrolase protein [Cladorrhinum samala]